jgi:hypothetical protein
VDVRTREGIEIVKTLIFNVVQPVLVERILDGNGSEDENDRTD